MVKKMYIAMSYPSGSQPFVACDPFVETLDTSGPFLSNKSFVRISIVALAAVH